MATLTGVTMIQRFSYRGDPNEEYSNTWHFRDAPPSTSADWVALFEQLATHVANAIPATHHIIRAYGYDSDADDAVSVASYDWEQNEGAKPGVIAPPAGAHQMAGDQAAYITWQLDQRDARGHYICARKYFHGGWVSATDPDHLDPTYKAALQVLADAMAPGPGGNHGGIRTKKSSAPVNYSQAAGVVTTRTLRRRGKRPLAHA